MALINEIKQDLINDNIYEIMYQILFDEFKLKWKKQFGFEFEKDQIYLLKYANITIYTAIKDARFNAFGFSNNQKPNM